MNTCSIIVRLLPIYLVQQFTVAIILPMPLRHPYFRVVYCYTVCARTLASGCVITARV